MAPKLTRTLIQLSQAELESLDLAASEGEELCLVGTASEVDALLLGLFVSEQGQPWTTGRGRYSEHKIKFVSSSAIHSHPIAFICHPARPYPSPVAMPNFLAQLIALVGSNNINQVIHKSVAPAPVRTGSLSTDHRSHVLTRSRSRSLQVPRVRRPGPADLVARALRSRDASQPGPALLL